MLVKIFNHFRLAWRLLHDRRVNGWLKFFLLGLPLAYMVLPLPLEVPDFFPLLGLVDDLFFLGVTCLIFNALCPQAVVQEQCAVLERRPVPGSSDLETYRYPAETRDLAFGFLLIAAILVTVGALVGVVMLLFFGLSYLFTRWERSRMLANAVQASQRQLPDLHQALLNAQATLPPIGVNLFVTQNPIMNAYAFGYDEPYSIVLTSALVEKFNPAELQAVIGHELGHILLGHVRIISIMATSVTGLERLFFYRWNRSCEYSADAIALLACDGDLTPVVSALLKLSSGMVDVPIDLQAFLDQDCQEQSKIDASSELLSTHPFISHRLKHLVGLAAAQREHLLSQRPSALVSVP